MEKCTKCLIEKEIELFHKDSRLKSGYTKTCSDCIKAYKKYHYAENKEKYLLKAKVWKSENKESVRLSDKKSRAIYKKENYERCKAWQESNKEIVTLKSRKWQINNKEQFDKSRKKYRKEKMKTDPIYAFRQRTRSLILTAIKRGGYTKRSTSETILGCTFLFFRNYIEAQFKNGMHWDNIHLDHIRPMSIAKTEQEVLDLNHYTNFQPLFASDNIRKSNKLIEKQLRLL